MLFKLILPITKTLESAEATIHGYETDPAAQNIEAVIATVFGPTFNLKVTLITMLGVATVFAIMISNKLFENHGYISRSLKDIKNSYVNFYKYLKGIQKIKKQKKEENKKNV